MVKIVSLLPSSTEIVCALGMEKHLVARSHECDYPQQVSALPPVTAPKFNTDGRSYEINQRVKAILQESTSVYRLDVNLLKTLNPDILITQSQCDVCAVNLDEVRKVVCEWLGLPTRIITLEPNTLADVYQDIQRLADALNIAECGAVFVESMQRAIDKIAQKTHNLNKPRVATLEWLDPLMSGGHWIPELVTIAGGTNLFGEIGHHSPWITWDELVAADPEVIVILPCGYDIPTIRCELPVLIGHPAWKTLRAVKTNQVYITDGNQYFNRPGPRLLESLEILTEIYHPDHFHFGHEGSGWQRL